MDTIQKFCIDFLQTQNSDALALGVLRFKDNSFSSFQIEKTGKRVFESEQEISFDLASLSKPLTNSLGYFSAPKRVDANGLLLLNHRAGLPAWGLLPKHGWKEIICGYPIKESPALYSDYSALRFMLEFNSREGSNAREEESLHQIAAKTWDEKLLFWTDLNSTHRTVQNGFLKGRPNLRAVHDPNAYNIGELVSHAGLFGSIEGVCATLLNFNSKYGLLKRMQEEMARAHDRFVLGWDTVADVRNTLAGNGCGAMTFGHLGFTGVSIWIDPEKSLGQVLLTNATKEFWHDKLALNELRKALGGLIWKE